MFDRFVCPPSGDDVAELEHLSRPYTLLGFPGAIASVDGVHIGWERAPEGSRSWFTGKEKVPTLQFNCAVERTGRFISVSGPVPGATNDKTALRYDTFVHKGQGAFGRHAWEYLDATGHTQTEYGSWIITDAGYHRWRCLQCPVKSSTSPATAGWSAHIESVRKDVGCAFGRLKGRFRALKLPCLFHSQEKVANQFKCCVVLQNRIMDHVGRGDEIVQIWEREDGEVIDWGDAAHATFDTSNELDLQAMVQLDRRMASLFKERRVASCVDTDFDVSHVGLTPKGWMHAPGSGTDVEIEPGWMQLRYTLVTHWLQP